MDMALLPALVGGPQIGISYITLCFDNLQSNNCHKQMVEPFKSLFRTCSNQVLNKIALIKYK